MTHANVWTVPSAARLAFLLALPVSLAVGPAAAQPGSSGVWAGSIQCVLDVQQQGYTRRETQTWSLAGSPKTEGAMSIYTGTWTASGTGVVDRKDGARSRNAQWAVDTPPQPKQLAVFVRPSDGKLIIRQWGSRLSVANALTGSRRIEANNPESINNAAYEWDVGWIESDPATRDVRGSRAIAAEALQADLMPPAGTATVPQCTWQLAQGNTAVANQTIAAASASSGVTLATTNASNPTVAAATSPGCSGAAASLASLYSVLRADATRQYDSVIQSAGNASLTTALSAQKQKMLATLATQQQQDIDAAAVACGAGGGAQSGGGLASRVPPREEAGSRVAVAGGAAALGGAVLALPLTLAPSSASLDRPTVTVTLTGQSTHFAQGTTSVDFHIPGAQAALTVVSPTTATAQLTVPASTPTGRYTVTLTSGAEVAEANGGFMVTPKSDSIGATCGQATNSGSIAPGSIATRTGYTEYAAAEDWYTVSFPPGSSLNLRLRSATAGPGGSEFQLQLFSACGAPIGTGTSGSGQKAMAAPDSGPHTLFVRVTANPWDVARPIYTLEFDNR